jgi:hypothetical protein
MTNQNLLSSRKIATPQREQKAEVDFVRPPITEAAKREIFPYAGGATRRTGGGVTCCAISLRYFWLMERWWWSCAPQFGFERSDVFLELQENWLLDGARVN